MFHGFFRAIDKFLVSCFSSTKIIGKENITSGNVIFVCNHQSVFDAFVNFELLPKNTHFMAKKEFCENKLLAFCFKHLQVFPVDRQKLDMKSIRHACSILSENNNLCIFPQGTRHAEPEINLDDMHNGIAMLALRYNSKIVPMMFLDKPGFFKKNTLVIGKEVDLSEFAGKKASSEIQTAFSRKVGEEMNKLLDGGRKMLK